MQAAKSVDEYISSFPEKTQKLLQQIRMCIKSIAPDAKEVISYGMPAYKQNKILVYFAGYAKHISFYPTASGIENFKKELSPYKTSKGTIQFQLDKPLPLDLIRNILIFRINEDLENK